MKFKNPEEEPLEVVQKLDTTGYIQTIRKSGPKLIFLILRTQNNNSNSSKKIQLVVKDPSILEDLKLNRECFVHVYSDCCETKKPPVGSTFDESWILKDLKILGHTSVIPSVALGQTLNVTDQPQLKALKMRSHSEHRKILARAYLYEAIRNFFKLKGVVEYDSPKLSLNYTESGAEVFQLSNCADGKKRVLIQSPQLHKQRLINAGFQSVYQIGHIFRNEKFNTSRHMCETTCLDVESSNHNVSSMILLIKDLIIYVSSQLAALGTPVYKKHDFITLTYEQALKLANSSEMDRNTEKKITQIVGKEFVFVTNYPNSERPFYTLNDTGFDLLHQKCELISGATRISNIEDLKRVSKEKNVDLDQMIDYKRSFELGCPTTTGFALGLDRFLMVLLDLDCVQETLYF